VSGAGLAKEESMAHGYRLGDIIGMGVFSHVHIALIRKNQDSVQSSKNRTYVSSSISEES